MWYVQELMLSLFTPPTTMWYVQELMLSLFTPPTTMWYVQELKLSLFITTYNHVVRTGTHA